MIPPALERHHLCLNYMGALFRIKLIQRLLALSMTVFGIYQLVTIIDFNQLNLSSTQLAELAPYVLLVLTSVLYLFIQSTFLVPVALIGFLSIIYLSSTPFNLLLLSWVGTLLALLIYPFFYYKYLDFKRMLSMLRLTIPIGIVAVAIQLYPFIISSTLAVALVTGFLMILSGNIFLIFSFKKWIATGLIAIGSLLLAYIFQAEGMYVHFILLIQTLVYWIILHHDTSSYEPKAWEFAYSSYYRIVALGLILAPFIYNRLEQLESFQLALK